MGIISFTSRGSFDHMERFLRSMQTLDLRGLVEPYARQGVDALSRATPVDTGLAARSWDYEIDTSNGVTVRWINHDVENGFPVVIMLQYGHGTGTGGYVQGRDFINPAIQPIMDEIANAVWKVVTSA
jgi:hypothetical protein